MNRFLPDYNDPIVSILMLLGIIFIVATLSYAYSIYRQNKRVKELLDFVENFDSNECLLDTKNLEYEESMKKPLFLLAHAYLKSGEYSKSINLYLYLLKYTKDEALLAHLAEAYLLAGFLRKSLNVYLEILSKKPRDRDSLYKLELIYEKLNELDNARDALTVLSNLGEDVSKLNLHLDIIEITKSSDGKELKFSKLVKLMQKYDLEWAIVRELFKIDAKEAFKYYKDDYFEHIVDSLYLLGQDKIDFGVVEQSNNLEALYYIKGFYNKKANSDIFAINLVASAKSCDFNSGDLEFIYICQKCKTRYPLFFSRCLKCHRAYKIFTEVSVAKKAKRGKTLQ